MRLLCSFCRATPTSWPACKPLDSKVSFISAGNGRLPQFVPPGHFRSRIAPDQVLACANDTSQRLLVDLSHGPVAPRAGCPPRGGESLAKLPARNWTRVNDCGMSIARRCCSAIGRSGMDDHKGRPTTQLDRRLPPGHGSDIALGRTACFGVRGHIWEGSTP